MRRRYLVWVVLVLFGMIVIGTVMPCMADGGDNPADPGDPYEIPGSKPLKPTASILCEFWMILMAMAFQLAL